MRPPISGHPAAQAPRCSDGARLRSDPLIGTAPPARRWLLIELDGGWLPDAVDSLRISAADRAELAEAARRAQARIMLIRRPGRRRPAPPLTRKWCVVDDPATAGGPMLTWGTWRTPDSLVHAARVLRAAAGTADHGAPQRHDQAGSVRVGDQPQLLLVCAHGRHDVCCATRGRPVAASLAARWPEATWECSHTGGDRFAANLIVLPDGACYGGLDPDIAVNVVEQHHVQGPDTAYLRGRTGYSPAAQAAVLAAHQELPEARWGEVVLESMRSGGARHLVTVRKGNTRLEVDIVEDRRPAQRLTCAAPTLGRATVPVVRAVRRIPQA